MTAGVRDERGEEQNREEGENEMWEIPLGLLGLP